MKQENRGTFKIHFESPTAEKSESSLFLIWTFVQYNPRRGQLLAADSAGLPACSWWVINAIDKWHWMLSQPYRGLTSRNLHAAESKPEKEK